MLNFALKILLWKLCVHWTLNKLCVYLTRFLLSLVFLFKLSYAELFIIAAAGSFISSLCMFVYPQNLLSPTIRDLKMVESSGFHQNVDLSSLLSKFISDFENPTRKTRERNYKHCVRLFERTVKASNLPFVAKCRH